VGLHQKLWAHASKKEKGKNKEKNIPKTMASGEINQDTGRYLPSKGYSIPGDHIRVDKSGHRKNPTRRTHRLETTLEGNKLGHRKKPIEWGHSQAGDSIRRDKSEQGKNLTEQGALTLWT
jgi:hypothetical protein